MRIPQEVLGYFIQLDGKLEEAHFFKSYMACIVSPLVGLLIYCQEAPTIHIVAHIHIIVALYLQGRKELNVSSLERASNII